jgi:hypothetical protein
MFRQKDPQSSLFETSNLVPEAKARRLHASWAETFRVHALPLIEEEQFAPLYCEDNGRPNRPVQTVFGVLLLKEMFGLTDEEALEQLEFSLLWHHALALTPEEAHLPQKTLHNFRARLLAHDEGREAFTKTTDGILEALGTKVNRQRLDSTHVISNIAVLSRLGLFCETIRHFLSTLEVEHPRLFARVPPRLRRRYLKEDGSATAYQDAASATGRRRLSVCARDLYRLCQLFEDTAAAGMEAFTLMQRVLQEQCDVLKKKQRPSRDDDDAGEGGVPVVLKAAKQVSSASLQSPHDPDVTYNAHKGKGYEVQIAETCDEDNAVEVITHVAVTEACSSDEHATIPTLEALAARGQQPEEIVADTAYGSGDNAVEAERQGTELVSPVRGPKVAVEVAPEKRPLTAADFVIDANLEDPAVCPAGHFAVEQTRIPNESNRVVLTFAPETCEGCPLFHGCPAQPNRDGKGYELPVDLVAANIERRRRAIANGAFRERYRIRAGIEATNSELKRRHRLGSLRVRRRGRVVLAVHLKALACNFKRMVRALTPQPGGACPAMG